MPGTISAIVLHGNCCTRRVTTLGKPTFDVALAIVHRADEWLVARRRTHAHLGGLWEFPGGKCEPNEPPATAAIRELMEECDVEAAPERVLPAVRFDYGDRVVQLTGVVCRWIAGDGRPLGCDECRWVSTAELAALDMPAANAGIVAAALDGHPR
ncbi:MAG: (deoxy)nucleoside triphosphate pyrophosphohydrolase [Phycisphaerae bacterium]